MEKPDSKIIKFIQKHHVLTLATTSGNSPWCSNCFYAYEEDKNVLIFTSDPETRHIKETSQNPQVAGSIVLETEIIGKIQGIQFTGYLQVPADISGKYKTAYLKRFPYAIIGSSPLWVLELTYIKFTDNLLGFGKKLIWEKHKTLK
jgi:hypothetical protein